MISPIRTSVHVDAQKETRTDYSSDYLDQIVKNTQVPISKLEEKIQKQLLALEKSPGDIKKMIELQLEVGKRSLMISTTTGSLKTAKDDAATVARAI